MNYLKQKEDLHEDPLCGEIQIIRNCLGYCAYSKDLENSLLQKQAKELVEGVDKKEKSINIKRAINKCKEVSRVGKRKISL